MGTATAVVAFWVSHEHAVPGSLVERKPVFAVTTAILFFAAVAASLAAVVGAVGFGLIALVHRFWLGDSFEQHETSEKKPVPGRTAVFTAEDAAAIEGQFPGPRERLKDVDEGSQ
jgi:hypothetical protein